MQPRIYRPGAMCFAVPMVHAAGGFVSLLAALTLGPNVNVVLFWLSAGWFFSLAILTAIGVSGSSAELTPDRLILRQRTATKVIASEEMASLEKKLSRRGPIYTLLTKNGDRVELDPKLNGYLDLCAELSDRTGSPL